MTVDEMIEKLSRIKHNGYGKLLVAIPNDSGEIEAMSCRITLSEDGVGQYVYIGDCVDVAEV